MPEKVDGIATLSDGRSSLNNLSFSVEMPEKVDGIATQPVRFVLQGRERQDLQVEMPEKVDGIATLRPQQEACPARTRLKCPKKWTGLRQGCQGILALEILS